MGLPIVRLTGTPFEQGEAHGAELRDAIRHNLRVYFHRFLEEGEIAPGDVLQRASRYAAAIARRNADYYDGMRGIALGSGLSLEEVAALNVRYEILYFQQTQKYMKRSVDGCTAFTVLPERSANGHLWLGQNWDWIPDASGAIVHTVEPGGFQTLAFTEAGIFGAKIGLNSAGVGLAINGLSSTGDDWQRLTAPFHVRCYEILRQTDAAAARDVVAGEPRACSGNFLIAAAPDQAVDLEAAPDTCRAIMPHGGLLVHTNHFLDPATMGIEEPPNDIRPYSCGRQDRLAELLTSVEAISREHLQGLLRDHENWPYSICRHEIPHAPVEDQYRTVSSIIIDLHDRELWASAGPPCEHPYHSYRLDY